MSSGNGHAHVPAEVVEFQYPPIAEEVLRKPRHRPLWTPLILFLLTIISTLAVGAEFSISYSQNREPFSSDENPFTTMARPFEHPELLALGIPFSFTLLGILLAHELGHYFTCRKYGIDVTYPVFHSRADHPRHFRRVHPHPLADPHAPRAIRRRPVGPGSRLHLRRPSSDFRHRQFENRAGPRRAGLSRHCASEIRRWSTC